MFKKIKSQYKEWRHWDSHDECDMYNFEYQYDYQDENGNRDRNELWMKIVRGVRRLTHYKSKTSKWCYYRPYIMFLRTITAYPRFAWGELKMRFEMWLCDKYGHKIVDDSSAGPDSGDMDCYCKRCGMSWHHQLY